MGSDAPERIQHLHMRPDLGAFMGETVEYVRADLLATAEAERDDARAARLDADNALVDKYRDPKTGMFSFPSDVARIIQRLEAERDAAVERAADTDRILSDPTAVHINLLAGKIAKPSEEQILHVYPAIAERLDAAVERAERLTKALRWYAAEGEADEFLIVDAEGERVASFASMASRARAALEAD